jgi:zeta-carotene desaturase
MFLMVELLHPCAALPVCSGLKAFFTTPQLAPADKLANSLALGTSPIVRALFDPEGGMQDIRALDNISFTDWFISHGGSMQSIKRMWDPIGEH